MSQNDGIDGIDEGLSKGLAVEGGAIGGRRWRPSQRKKLAKQLGSRLRPDAKITNVILPAELPNHIKKFIEDNKDTLITYISVCRVPVSGALETAANLITLGGFEKAKANRDIDKFFHLFMLIGLSNGRRIVYEKNQRVTLFETYKQFSAKVANCIPIPNANGIRFGDFVAKGIKVAGPSNYFRYEATTNNCQQFVHVNLAGSNLWTQQISQFVMQNVEQILPKWLKKGLKSVTDIAAVGERITGYKPPTTKTEGKQIDHPILEARRQQQDAIDAIDAVADTVADATPEVEGEIKGSGGFSIGWNYLI